VNSRQGPEQKRLLQKAHQFAFLFLRSLKLFQPPLVFLVAQYVLKTVLGVGCGGAGAESDSASTLRNLLSHGGLAPA
jgi:hypothetical protein